jgi:hypothetical protein
MLHLYYYSYTRILRRKEGEKKSSVMLHPHKVHPKQDIFYTMWNLPPKNDSSSVNNQPLRNVKKCSRIGSPILSLQRLFLFFSRTIDPTGRVSGVRDHRLTLVRNDLELGMTAVGSTRLTIVLVVVLEHLRGEGRNDVMTQKPERKHKKRTDSHPARRASSTRSRSPWLPPSYRER